jgi:hypothetical protein
MAGMLFGRLRVPLDRALSPEPRDRHESGFHVVAVAGADPRGEAPRGDPARVIAPRLSLVPPAELPADGPDPYAGLERLDREELDED